ncbi:hypothetical protein ACWD5V_34655 [Streptomyces sp. NPDC002523]
METAADASPAKPAAGRRPDRAGLLVAAAVLAACAGLVLYGILGTDGNDSTPTKRTPTAAVTYEVTGTGIADLTYQARNETGKAVTVQDSRLPWHKTVQVPLGPVISIVLDEHGGTARCTLAIRGHHAQSATATGAFGRATCSSPLTASDADRQG